MTFFIVRRKHHRKDVAETEYNLQGLLLSGVCKWASTSGDFLAFISRHGHIFSQMPKHMFLEQQDWKKTPNKTSALLS